ncbi:hypothetical protein ZWY2020_052203 [Hordeum vulgare]|nr:hypothetical protein ZWY2020_052203 [Hordeum vulgare]
MVGAAGVGDLDAQRRQDPLPLTHARASAPPPAPPPPSLQSLRPKEEDLKAFYHRFIRSRQPGIVYRALRDILDGGGGCGTGGDEHDAGRVFVHCCQGVSRWAADRRGDSFRIETRSREGGWIGGAGEEEEWWGGLESDDGESVLRVRDGTGREMTPGEAVVVMADLIPRVEPFPPSLASLWLGWLPSQIMTTGPDRTFLSLPFFLCCDLV